MLLTITTTHQPATDLGHLLRNYPGKTHVFEQSFGQAHVLKGEPLHRVPFPAPLVEKIPRGGFAWKGEAASTIKLSDVTFISAKSQARQTTENRSLCLLIF
jgi:hypothetical protein